MSAILVIDDDASIRNTFQRYLEGHGYVVHVAADGKEGMHLMEAEPPDLVITDIMMPEADGLEVVMSVASNGLDIPVIAISGGMHAAAMDFLPIAKKFGASKVLYKPVDLETLHDTVAGLLQETSA